MTNNKNHRSILENAWDVINIYEGPEIFLESFNRVQREVGLLYAATFCVSEVCNGGFDQFFWNATGILAPEAVEGFKSIGQPQIGSLVSQAMDLFGIPYIRQREARQEALDRLPESDFDKLDEKFYSLIRTESGGFEAASDNYLRVLDTSQHLN